MFLLRDQAAAAREFKQRYAFLYRPASDDEEVPPVGFGEAAIAFGEIGGDREGSTIQLVGQEPITVRKLLRVAADGVGEIDALLVDLKLFEAERHFAAPRKREGRVESRPQGRGETGEPRADFALLSTFSSLLLYWRLCRQSGRLDTSSTCCRRRSGLGLAYSPFDSYVYHCRYTANDMAAWLLVRVESSLPMGHARIPVKAAGTRFRPWRRVLLPRY